MRIIHEGSADTSIARALNRNYSNQHNPKNTFEIFGEKKILHIIITTSFNLT
jgi:hypothetical protein